MSNDFADSGAALVIRRYGVAHQAGKTQTCIVHSARRSATASSWRCSPRSIVGSTTYVWM